MNYSRAKNDILFSSDPALIAPHKVAVIDKNGELRMAKGQAEHREAVEAFLRSEGHESPPEQPLPDRGRQTAQALAGAHARVEMARQPIGNPSSGDIPPCPPEDPTAGDKTPEVVAWWFKYHPKKAGEKYAGRKGTNITGRQVPEPYESSDRDADIARAADSRGEE